MAEIRTHADAQAQSVEDKAVAARNLEALKIEHTAYIKIQAYCPVSETQADSVLRAAEVFLEALKGIAVTPTKADVTIAPPTTAQEKKALEETRKAEEKRPVAEPR